MISPLPRRSLAFLTAVTPMMWLPGAAVSSAAEQPGKTAIIFHDASIAPIVFAAGEIRPALEAIGFSVGEKSPADLPDAQAPVRIVLATAGDERVKRAMEKEVKLPVGNPGQQGFAIRKTAGPAAATYWIIGGDAAGTMYGTLHLAEQVRLGKGLQAVVETFRRPYLLRRGIKFNIPLDARTPSFDDSGDAAQQNYVHMWDFAFWREFLDGLARHRYNALTLWNPHPFPSIVKLPDYGEVALDDVCVTTLPPDEAWQRGRHPSFVSPQIVQNLKVVKQISIDEKIAFWRRVMRHAKDRGIDVYFITWNVYVNAAEGKYGITPQQDNPKTIAYLRACIRECILAYPDLAGIGVTAGEHMQRRGDEFAKEKWLWSCYGQGVLDAKRQQPGRTVRFIHRVWQTGVGEVIDDFGSKYPDPFELSFKYARAHVYSSTRPPFAAGLCDEMKPHGVKCWWNLRNDDVFNFRWGDPDYVREFLRNLPPGQTAGYHMGSDGYVWGREFTSLQPESPRELEIEKHWYKFMLWGRLGYNPELDRAFFIAVLGRRFPEAPAAELYDAWQAASKIVPLVNRFHWRNWDFMWAVEGCMDHRGFRTVDDFINTPPMERSGILSIPEYVEGRLAGRAANAITPIDVAGQLGSHAQRAARLLDSIRAETPSPGKELRHTLGDVEAMAHLGNYYAAKVRGAVELCARRRSKDPKRRQAAVEHLTQAVEHWRRYAAIASKQYRPQLLARTRRLDWLNTLDDVKRDVEIARNGM